MKYFVWGILAVVVLLCGFFGWWYLVYEGIDCGRSVFDLSSADITVRENAVAVNKTQDEKVNACFDEYLAKCTKAYMVTGFSPGTIAKYRVTGPVGDKCQVEINFEAVYFEKESFLIGPAMLCDIDLTDDNFANISYDGCYGELYDLLEETWW